MRVILICGFLGSGKDLVGEYLKEVAEEHGKTVKTFAFADKIRETLMKTFHLRNREDYDLFKRSTFLLSNSSFMRPLNGREVLRDIGMAMRSCNERAFLEDVSSRLDENAYNIITDLRFNNEFDWARESGYTVIKVKKNGTVSDGHVSEHGFPDNVCDYVIENNGTKEELREKVKRMYEDIEKWETDSSGMIDEKADYVIKYDGKTGRTERKYNV